MGIALSSSPLLPVFMIPPTLLLMLPFPAPSRCVHEYMNRAGRPRLALGGVGRANPDGHEAIRRTKAVRAAER